MRNNNTEKRPAARGAARKNVSGGRSAAGSAKRTTRSASQERPSGKRRYSAGEGSVGDSAAESSVKRTYSRTSTRPERPSRKFADRDERPERPARRFADRDERPERPARKFADRGERPERPARKFADRGERPERPARKFADRGERPERPARKFADRGERPERPARRFADRDERPERPARRFGDRDERPERPARRFGDRDERPERPARRFADRGERPERPARRFADRDERPERPARRFADRDERPERPARRFADRDERPERPARRFADRDERPERPARRFADRDERPERPARRFADRDERPERPARRFADRDERPERPSRSRAQSYTPKPRQPKGAGEEGVRLNKFIANSGICSRREADDYITAGLISVNGVIITELGTKVFQNDEVKFNGERIKGEEKVYLVMNKPKDFITTMSDPHAEKTVMNLIEGKCPARVYPVGRLDKATTGVLLFTNDGELADKLMHPSFEKKKIYHVYLDKNFKQPDFQKLLDGIELEDGLIKADGLSYIDEDKTQVGVEIHSGRNRIVRRMFEELGYKIKKLDRVYFAGLTKKNLRRGQWRFLTDQEIAMLKMGSFE